jgi:hypothetical protein
MLLDLLLVKARWLSWRGPSPSSIVCDLTQFCTFLRARGCLSWFLRGPIPEIELGRSG